MESVVLVIHLFLALAIIGLVLIQRSEGGGLGLGGDSGGGMGNFATAQGAATMLTKITGACAAGFFVTSMVLGILAGGHTKDVGLMDAVSSAASVEQAVPAEGQDVVPAAPVTENNEESSAAPVVPVAPVTK